MAYRLAVAATSREALCAALDAAAQGQAPPGAVRGHASTGSAPKVVFVFPGQGSQWLGMGRKLLSEEPVFRAALSACDGAIQAEAGWSLLAELAADEATSQLGRIDVVQPALFAIEVALSALWRSWGIEPDAVVGHSMGEVAAAHVAGALSLEDAVAIICRRSQLLRRISGRGEMAVVELSLAEAEAALLGYEGRLSVAVSNSPRSTVLAGEPAALAEVLEILSAKGVFCRRVKVDVASHSPQIDPLRDELVAALGEIEPRRATVSMHSTVTGTTVGGPELGASYWADNVRQPVRFAEAVQALMEGGHGLFVEMSPHPLLSTSVEEIRLATKREGVAVGSLRRGQDERLSMLEALGALWVHGAAVGWERLSSADGAGFRRVPLPTYAWQRERYWVEPSAGGAANGSRLVHAGGHPLLGEMQTLSTQKSTRVWETTLDLGRARRTWRWRSRLRTRPWVTVRSRSPTWCSPRRWPSLATRRWRCRSWRPRSSQGACDSTSRAGYRAKAALSFAPTPARSCASRCAPRSRRRWIWPRCAPGFRPARPLRLPMRRWPRWGSSTAQRSRGSSSCGRGRARRWDGCGFPRPPAPQRHTGCTPRSWIRAST
ncbi:hypothetical protein BE21_58010 [Sorangium cellulosum]|uniref:Malonyl-CoA:ACP transacylase (MAT) domain-containing protein n=1 Tax=Sorangium cellulosum TaxID=56 RepID=A0A150U2P7_SORCE|nr:hypothetical protein BE21_58010 [Sorangium cellulosum]